MNSVSPLPFPSGRPEPYRPLTDEPVFDAAVHLALEKPERSTNLQSLGYQPHELEHCESDFAHSSAFRILSQEGVAAMHHVCE